MEGGPGGRRGGRLRGERKRKGGLGGGGAEDELRWKKVKAIPPLYHRHSLLN